MKITRRDFKWAIDHGLIEAGPAERLWEALAAHVAERPKFDLTYVAYYAGAMVVILAMTWFMTEAWDRYGELGLLVLAWLLLRRYRANAYRRHALARLARLQAAYQEHADTSSFLAEINALLKGVALHAYPRRDIAATSGGPWLAFLEGTAGRDVSFPSGFAIIGALLINLLADLAQGWLDPRVKT